MSRTFRTRKVKAYVRNSHWGADVMKEGSYGYGYWCIGVEEIERRFFKLYADGCQNFNKKWYKKFSEDVFRMKCKKALNRFLADAEFDPHVCYKKDITLW